MLIIGAKGFAKEVLEVCHQNNELENLAFYDDVNNDVQKLLYDKFPIITSLEEAKNYLKNTDNRFNIGIGNPNLRKILYNKFSQIGGVFVSTIASTAVIGHYSNIIGSGSNIMQNVVITNDIVIGRGVIINQVSSIGHDVIIGDFVEICPNVSISGNCTIGENTFIGTNAVVLPKITIGKNAIIGAGSVVTKDIPDNCTAIGIPAKVIKQN
ncbi:sugar O-acyltransferase (sialic acid O-acetyltransferase NeuD family) [Chryseobacterium ginsenosidimutans]|uniref:acetyltransferase n=1 Tax=Chryseobacterium ginsenosidimutans TaxID=687846 RepID=UPI00278876BB|nr:acetyltransferase [Chryseobacterium ginsenosidimutans]MDQ0591900.1 sugar O-acyltransferase (sialic acid O-acetyltransferase NeuD family) [Chryseobacterium ginsenosidimutans]